ncbi:TetR/AcrR family transcriptional regulator [Actinobacteria bacterium YIM 96077]|uniref:TetR/AcrR family transcriptional regulator n=1 Tax=Phytoactinopolyspora halophila TaxID=1981511 RepID=A0A329QUR8_9ACTN|nr:TetR/AcrR family transcriptional regulator [Phytoactinopolyspora halophila]AYY14881.1 TetR/AcrR family transcriptional regulator [Actinobacteria bacterium YIM 96077]RAW15339.1 TetR/AcrR family transcriptional regulator [Phytoactinopolyspora halophila]
MTFQRARSVEQRQVRRQAILDTAASMLAEMPVAEVSLNEMSRRVGLAKSNVLRYFESREAVLLELLDGALQAWLAEISDELAASVDPQLSARERGDQLAAVLSRSLAGATTLCDLINAQPGVLEHNVSVDVVVHYKRSALHLLATMIDLVRSHLPELRDHARMVCMTTLILAGALSTYGRPSASTLAAYEVDPTLAELHLDLASMLESAVGTLITGALASD